MGGMRNTCLEALLAEFGYTHQQLADEVNRVAEHLLGAPANCTDRHVRRWIAGDVRLPWSRYLLPLQEIFGRGPEAMGFVPRKSSKPLPPPVGPASANARSGVQRRTFIAGALATTLGIDQTPGHGRLGVGDIDRIQGTITRLDAHFNGLGGGALIDVTVDYLSRLEHALDHCTYSERVERGMHRAIAEVAACAGWSAHDCGQYEKAAHLRNHALQAALLSRDPVCVTRAWSDLAAQAEHAGRPAEAARINRAALSERHLRARPLISSLLNARLADCLAQTGDLTGMGRHLAAAERTYDRANTTAAPSWLAFLTPAELSGLGAIAHQSAGQYRRAEAHAAQALELLEERFTRNRAYYGVLLAELQLAQGEHERAVATASGIRTVGVISSRITARLERVTAVGRSEGGPP
ncbi:tetratricopeptide repeat protein [Streptomyces lincolnensis]|uniref:tetratricopeptide repeat protein n=1 Tax=Streptomyces lincolnensis TaxID=1915 RepID=UPI001E5BAC68|nr:tetratricopeptide repeat protein [Streptomyces lincolnensis]MCD7444189.1 tetratricopeptide repeat protein [Streptomyces lincolnensis]